MSARYRYLVPLAWALLLLAAVAWGQDEEWKEYSSGFSLFSGLIPTIIWSSAYLLIYTAALVITLSYLQRFGGFDGDLFLWIGLLWFGGMVINAYAYRVAHVNWLAAILALPCLFGWSLLVSTRAFAELTVREAIKVSLVLALVCAPYFGTTWHMGKTIMPGIELDRPRTQAPAYLAVTAHAFSSPPLCEWVREDEYQLPPEQESTGKI